MNNYYRLRDDKYVLQNLNQDAQKLLRLLKGSLSSTPFIDYDMAVFIVEFEHLKTRTISDAEIEYMVKEAVFYFRMGDPLEIKRILKGHPYGSKRRLL